MSILHIGPFPLNFFQIFHSVYETFISCKKRLKVVGNFYNKFQDATGGIWKLDLSFTHTVSTIYRYC